MVIGYYWLYRLQCYSMYGHCLRLLLLLCTDVLQRMNA
jgi:hypothetical protein